MALLQIEYSRLQLSLAARLPSTSWSGAEDGHDAISPVPFARWDLEAPRNGRSQLRARFGSFLQDIDFFDAALFGISIPEAEVMDPQQRLLLEVPKQSTRLILPIEFVVGTVNE